MFTLKIWPQGQRDRLGEYCTFKASNRTRERGLLKPQPRPALERGQYEKQMDHRWSCRSERFAWRRPSRGAFLESDQMGHERPEPHAQPTARPDPRVRQQ